jgi:NAD-dependent deacetylase
MSAQNPHDGDDEAMEQARRWVESARRVVVFTGAGISTESGIPDFRGPQGVWTRNPAAERMSTLQHYLGDPEVRKAAWQSRLGHPAWEAKPNAGHMALVRLERGGRLHALITQNIDELHQAAGNSQDKVIELHGTMRKVVCWGCGRKGPMPQVLERVRAGDPDPHCESCGGILKSDTISFGQNLDPAVLERAMRAAGEAELLLSVGTSLQVYPAAGVVPVAREAGARIVINNAQPTPFDGMADAVIRAPTGRALPRICGFDA